MKLFAATIGLCIAWMAAAPQVRAQPAAAARAERTELDHAALVSDSIAAPVRMEAFARPQDAAPPSHALTGRLSLSPQVAGGFRVIRNEPFAIKVDAVIQTLPAFDFEFVQDGDAVIPLLRGPVPNAHRDWEFVLEPGRAWDEPGDGGQTRVALPFSLMERGSNCLHNGVLTFTFGGAPISSAYFQISSETCAYFKFDSWGVLPARFAEQPVSGAGETVSAYRAEVAARLPVKPLSALAAAHPGISLDAFALAPGNDGDLPTLYGVVVDGVNYVGGCETRAGPYPFCDVIDLPSYSTAKSVLAGLGLMRLEQRWPGASKALIADHVPECRSPDWQGATFENLLDMASGVFDEKGFEADEMAAKTKEFYAADRHSAKIGFACGRYRRKAEPGTTWVYRTTDTYVLGTAEQAFVKARLGAGADIFDMLRDDLWKPLGLSPVTMQTRRTYDAARQPFAGYGLMYHRDDIARIGVFLGSSNGRIEGRQLLEPRLLAGALFRDPADLGWGAGYPHYRYNNGFWARNLAPVLGCKTALWVPFLSGYGGNSVVMLPNGTVYYYFSDSWVWDWSPAAVQLDKIRPICP